MRVRTWMVRGMAGSLFAFQAAAGNGVAPVAFAQAPTQATAQTAGQSSATDKTVAVVNGESIPMSMLQVVLKQAGPTPVPLPEAVRRQRLTVALSVLINEVLMRQFLKQNAPPADAKAVEARWGDLMAKLQEQHKTLSDFCRDTKQTPQQVKERIASVLQWNTFARSRITDADLQNYYRENKDFFDKKQVHAAEIMMRVVPPTDQADRQRKRTQLTELRAKIVKKEIGFGQAAKKYSQGPTKDQGEGGDLEWFPRLKGILPASVLQAAFTLPAGQMSEVLDSEYGVHLIKVFERKEGEPSDFNKMKEDVRQFCIEDMQQGILKQLRQAAEKAGKVQVMLQ